MRFAGALGKTRLAVLVGYAGSIATLQMMVGEPRDPWWWFAFLPFFAWTIAPIGVPLAGRATGWFVTLGVGLIAAVSFYMYAVTMLGSDASSTAALVFIFMPLYQWIGVAFVFLIHWLSRTGEHDRA
jgi:hypothetical protein